MFWEEVLTVNLVNIITAVVILVVGWVVALILSSAARGVIKKTRLRDYLTEISQEDEEDKKDFETLNLEDWIGKIVYYGVMFFVLIALFQSLELTIVAEPFSQLLTKVFSYLPMILGALALILIAWITAKILRVVVLKSLKAAKIDERFDEHTDRKDSDRDIALSELISRATYWVVILLFIPAILTALQLEGLLQPVQNMVNKVLDFVPNIALAILIVVLGWLGARILSRIVTKVLTSLGTDNFSENIGLNKVIGEQKVSKLIGTVVYAFVMIVAIISALNALALEAITQPASNMLTMILEAIPAIFAAVLVLAIAYAVGSIIRGLVRSLLKAAGFDNILASLGISSDPDKGRWTPSEAVSYVLFTVIMLFATIEAASLLNFTLFSELIAQLLVFISQIILGLAIFGIALYLGNLAHNAIKVSDSPQHEVLAKIGKYAIIVLGGAMALQRMGLADEIIILAFGITLGGVVITGIIAFGIGGIDIAKRELENWVQKFKS